MAYQPGDTVVHPQHGTATVEGVLVKDIGRGPADYLQLYVESASMKIMVPAESVERIGIRDVSSEDDAEAILDVLLERSEVPEKWADRNPETVARMKSGNLIEMAMVVRDLSQHARRSGKPLSPSEKSVLDRCLAMLSEELSVSLGMEPDEMLALIAEKSAIPNAVSVGADGDAAPLRADAG